MGGALEWDADEHKAREKRIAERRTRVQERLRLQQQQRAKQGGGAAFQPGTSDQFDGSAAKGKNQAAASADVVRGLLKQQEAATEEVRTGAEQRGEEHRAACEEEEAALREQVAAEAEASRLENRAIDLEWEKLQSIKAPQDLAAGIATVSAHCGRVLESKKGALGAAHALLARRDEQFVRLLQDQAEETDALIATMHAQHAELRTVQENELETVEAAYLQERSELLAVQKAELDALLERRSAAEAEFMEQYLSACEQYENELEKMRMEGLKEHAALKRKLEAEIASLEAHLDGIKATYMLNADKLEYNYRVLVERERESKEALMQQKRKITRQWEVLNRLRKRHVAAEARAAAENARLSDEYQNVTRAFNHLQSKFRHFKGADLVRFEKLRAMKENELGELLEQLVEAEAFITSFVVGLPPPTPTTAAAQGVAAEAGAASPAPGTGLQLVGQAVTVDPLAASAAAAAAGLGSGEGPAEVVSMSAAEAAERGQLIPAYHPATRKQVAATAPAPAASAADSTHDASVGSSSGDSSRASSPRGPVPFGSILSGSQLMGSQASSGGAPAAVFIDGVAEEGLRASMDSGALSLLLGPDGRAMQSQQLRQLLAQVPAAAAAGEKLSADAVARSLGLQHSSTVAALERAFAGLSGISSQGGASSSGSGSGNGTDALAQTIGPREPEAPSTSAGGGAAAGSSAGGGAAAGGSAGGGATFTLEQVEQGLARLLQQLLSSTGRGKSQGTRTPAVLSSGGGAGAGAPPPTSKQYWQAKVDMAIPAAVVRAWGLLEAQASKRFSTLQGRTGAAKEVLALRQENEQLKSTLSELLNSPLNRELQLPPTLLLR